MRLPLRPLLDPALHEVDLPRRELDRVLGGRHPFARFGTADAAEEFALVGPAGGDDAFGPGFEVEAEAALALGLVGAVAGEAGVREDGAHVAVELDSRAGVGG